jgi:hypothetical protein
MKTFGWKGRVEPIYKQFRISRIVWNLRAAENAMARVIAENYLRLVVLCVQLSCHRNEKDTTRARANALREYLTHSEKDKISSTTKNCIKYLNCVCCKACASECPSNGYSSNEIGVFIPYQKQIFMAQ